MMRSPGGGINDPEPSLLDGSRPTPDDAHRPTARLGEVYRAHAGYVWRVLRYLGLPDDDLDDAVQETFLVVHRRLDEFDGRAALRSWLYAIALRVAATQRRSRRRSVARQIAAGALVHGESTVDPELEFGRAQAADVVDALLDELDPAKRAVFVLAEIEGVRVPEISQILGVNPHTVHSRLRLAREGFTAALRRLQARERGNVRIASLRARALLRHAGDDTTTTARRQAAFAALAIRIDAGAAPTLPGWESLTLTGTTTTTWLPAFAVGALVTVTAAMAWGGAGATSTTRHIVAPTPEVREPGAAPTTGLVAVDFPVAAAVAPAPPVEGPTTPRGRVVTPRVDAPIDAEDPAPMPSAPSSLEVETQLLAEARVALRRGEFDDALATLDRYDAAHPSGVLVDEGRSTRLRALCGAGRGTEARALADRLTGVEASPTWHAIVDASCR